MMNEFQENPQKVKKFGQTMAVVLTLLSAVFFWRHKPLAPIFLGLGFLFQMVTWVRPGLLIPVETIWMKIGHALGWINTRLILTAVFFLAFTPIRLILWFLRKDLLDEKLEKNRASYWKMREQKPMDSLSYERLY